ncbi:triphosphoribosyl-dephospho-CoA synthase [Methanobrevibacter sp. OttesenSCG-928-K11]|nr:triphosphoribosyl-dephospho-CoA synthase [Methanobrevibacter sp. OttesenSCG-928-K11]MDL2270884.1 triphosphoribosyl-dephospho-CoA synthase [Methanobrevibacter sp. OttesenSCG-928-I08]
MDSKTIAQIAQIASVLEVSGYPKPGNVHRTRDFHDMVFEDFLISGIAIGDTIKESCDNTLKFKDDLSKANLGKYILKGVRETDKWIKNNTNLGIVMMIIPIASAAIFSSNFDDLQINIGKLLENTTVDDAINLYDAIGIAEAGGMGSQDEYDVTSTNAKEELIKNNQTMYDVLDISASWDSLAYELTNKMPVTFEIGYPTFYSLKKDSSINYSTLMTFLTILSQVPDTLISRKYGIEKAEEVSEMALDIINYDRDKFNKEIKLFDDYLFENKLNPGTTADLTAASIMISYLKEEFEK